MIIEQTHGGGRPAEALAVVDNRKHLTRGELQEKVVARLNGAKSTLYGLSNCPWTQKQLLELGEFNEKLRVVFCDKDEHKKECEDAKLPGYPTWLIAGEQVAAYHRLEDLETIVKSLP